MDEFRTTNRIKNSEAMGYPHEDIEYRCEEINRLMRQLERAHDLVIERSDSLKMLFERHDPGYGHDLERPIHYVEKTFEIAEELESASVDRFELFYELERYVEAVEDWGAQKDYLGELINL